MIPVLVAIVALIVGVLIGCGIAATVWMPPLKGRVSELELELEELRHPRRRTLREALTKIRKAVADLAESLKSSDFKDDETRGMLLENAGPELKRHAAKLCRAKEMRQHYSELEAERIAWFLFSAVDRCIEQRDTKELQDRIRHLIQDGPDRVLDGEEPVEKAWWRPYMPSHRITRVADVPKEEP